MGKIGSLILSLSIVDLMIGCDFSVGHLELHEATVLLSEPEYHHLGDPDKRVAILPKGTTVLVLDEEYGKDFLAYKVKTDDGLKGYIIFGTSQLTLTLRE